MCLAIPALIEEIENGVATCRVGDGDTYIKASLSLLEKEPDCGEYLIVHAGFALRVLEEEEALETLRILRQMVEAMDQQELPPPGPEHR